MATNNKMQQIVNNTNLEIYKAKARTIFDEASKALVNDEISIEDLLSLDMEFDKAVMGVVNCEKEKARLNGEEVQNKRLLDLAREIVLGESANDEDECYDEDETDEDECYDEDDDYEDEEQDYDNHHVNKTIGMVLGMFEF